MFPVTFSIGAANAGGSLRATIARDFGMYAVRCQGVVVDTRYLPRRRAGTKNWSVIGLLEEGELVFDGREHVGPGQVFLATDRMFAPLDQPVRALRTRGERVTFICARFPLDVGADPLGLAIAPPVSEETRRLMREVGAIHTVDAAPASDDTVVALARSLLQSLRKDQLLRDEYVLAGDEMAQDRAAQAMFPVLSDLANQPMMTDLVDKAGVSERQMLRDIRKVQEDFDLFDRGWRESIVRWRTTAAVLLLSAPHLTPKEVATMAGYASTTAMGRAFHEAGLPPARELKKLLCPKTS
jgi:AraC-like DNA-binding protein